MDAGGTQPPRLKNMAAKLKDLAQNPGANAYAAGLGVAQTSGSVTPFHKTSASAKPKQLNPVRQD
ncbi:MAG: hypothetical protein ACK40L_05040 [Hydrogenophaga sp.]